MVTRVTLIATILRHGLCRTVITNKTATTAIVAAFAPYSVSAKKVTTLQSIILMLSDTECFSGFTSDFGSGFSRKKIPIQSVTSTQMIEVRRNVSRGCARGTYSQSQHTCTEQLTICQHKRNAFHRPSTQAKRKYGELQYHRLRSNCTNS